MVSAISSVIASVMMLVSPQKESISNLCADDCKLSGVGLSMIRTFEGYSPFVYKDAVGLPTVGFGHLIKPGEKFTEPLVGEDAEKLLAADLRPVERGINHLVTIDLHQGQFDALGSFSFNLGIGSLKSSTLLKRVNAGRHDEVPAQFMRWVSAGGKVLKGLVARREAEAEIYRESR